MDPTRFYQVGGWPTQLILLFGIGAALLSIVLAILAYALGSRRWAAIFAAVLVAVGLAAFLLGITGQSVGLHRVTRALAEVPPADREILAAVGAGEARVCLMFGLFAAILPWMAASIAIGRAAAARASVRTVAGGLVLAAAVCALVGGLAYREVTFVQRDLAAGYVHPAEWPNVQEMARAEARGRLVRGLGVGLGLGAVGAVLVAGGAARRRDPRR